MPPILVDAHEDLAYNMLNFGRDYTRPAAETRRLEHESGSPAPQLNGDTLLGWQDYQRGRVALVFATLFVTPLRRRLGDWETQVYADLDQAHQRYSAQLDAYHRLVESSPHCFRLIGSRDDLDGVLAHWAEPEFDTHPVGLLPLMEGAEGVRSPSELPEWWQRGVRIIGPAWAGTRFCGGSREPGPLTPDGDQLLSGMADLGFILDLSHMDELAARQSLDRYPGAVIASHSNVAALVPGYTGNRLLSDDILHSLLERDGIIGVVPFCLFMDYNWRPGETRSALTLERLAAHVDHICQVAGDALHVGIGTDFDGGFGVSMAPDGVDTIADLQQLGPILSAKGYNDEQVAAVLGMNWLRLLRSHLP